VGVIKSECRADYVYDALCVSIDIVVPESKYIEALRAQIAVACLIDAATCVEVMLPAVDLDDEPRRVAGEVDDEMVDRYLSAEMEAVRFQ